jgi:rare lipoprotein A (peptidoglycan hydrolase)
MPKIKTQVKRRLKTVHRLATKKKLLRQTAARRLARAVFVILATVSTGGLAIAISTTKPTLDIEVRTNINQAIAQLNPAPSTKPPDQAGEASWYALGLPAPDALTCASTKFPRGTYLLVTNRRNAQSVICLVNDYGPESWTGRAIDLSRGSFRVIDSLASGTTPVEIRVVPPPPSSFKLPIPQSFSAILGYSQCRVVYNVHYCEDNRQKAERLK